MRKILHLLLVTLIFNTISCSKDAENSIEEQRKETIVKSDANALISFQVTIDGKIYTAVINKNQVLLELPDDTDVTVLSPSIEISDAATINPKSGSSQNFSDVVTYTITAENGDKTTYEVQMISEKSSNFINRFSFKNLAEGQSHYTLKNKIAADVDTITYKVPYLSPVDALLSDINISENATIVPASGETLDYTKPVNYRVTSKNGTVKEYLVIVDNSLNKLEIDGFVSNQFIDKPLGANITFEVNTLNPILDSIQVKLVGDETYKLDVVSTDKTNKTITAKLPDAYLNDSYKLLVNIEHDNYAESDNFILNKGETNFKYVAEQYTTLLVPKETFYISAYIDRSVIDTYSFLLRKNNIDFPLALEKVDSNFQSYKLSMPALADASGMENGSDYTIVISKNGEEKEFDFVNINQQSIEVLVANNPVVSSNTGTTFSKNDLLTLVGENLYYPYSYSVEANAKSSLTFKYSTGGFSSSSNEKDANGNLKFNIENVPSGVYDLVFKNNVNGTNQVDYGQVTVLLDASEHQTLSVNSATLYSSTNSTTPKQILFSFSGNIDNVVIEEIVIERSLPLSDLVITNYFTNSSTVLTGAVSTSDYSTLFNRRHDGYVVIKDNGTSYKLPFKLESSI